jgi:hydroxymethylpyrimidine pyrophosphatase-like HAD family hydrolase
MRIRALATDYDGTLAHDGRVDDATLAGLARARANGLRLVLVTGRQLGDLAHAFPQIACFDRVVAENGAVLFEPSSSTVRLLASSPPPILVERLIQRGVPVSQGHTIVATGEPHEHTVLDTIRELGLEWHIVFNKGAVMALPAGVTKATGLAPALEEIGITPMETVGVGDAENDQSFLAACGLAVAVANALPSVIALADIVTVGERGAGVVELIDRICSGELDTVPSRSATTPR